MTPRSRVSAVVLAYGDEPWLELCLTALREDGGDELEIVVVDNGCTFEGFDELVERVGGSVLRPASNLGFASGCNAGARSATGDVLVFVNSDAIVERGCIDGLVAALADRRIGLASACIVLADSPERVNSVGNPVHVSGLTWAGGFGDPVSLHTRSMPVTSATGCVLAARRETWTELGGFWDDLFAYLEDTELSLRCWLRGLEVQYVAGARARHHYEFGRNDRKFYLLERNRLLLIATLYRTTTIVRLAPVLLLFELLMLLLALRQGWLPAKLRGWFWIVRHFSLVRRRRRHVQRTRSCGDQVILTRLRRRLDPSNVSAPPGVAVVDAIVRGWCRIALPRETADVAVREA